MASSRQRRGLGRGLGALIVNTDSQQQTSDSKSSSDADGGGVRNVDIDHIRPNPRQPRTEFDDASLAELAASIREHGVLQPLIVTQAPEDRSEQYWLIAGERRLRAAQLAGTGQVPVIIREASGQQLLEWALVENLQRADLNPLEEASAYLTLTKDFSLTQAEIANRVGKSRSAVANTLRLLQLPPAVQQAILAQQITAGHARALLTLPDENLQLEALEQILARDLSVRQTERLVKRMIDQLNEPDAPVPAQSTQPDSHHEFLENSFRTALGTRVNLNRNADGSGRLIVHFYSDEDLEHIFQVIAGDEG